MILLTFFFLVVKAIASPPRKEHFLRLIHLQKEQIENIIDRGEFAREALALRK